MEDILIDSQDRVYVATDGGLSILEGGRFRNYTTKDGLPSNILKALRMDHQGQLWIGTFEGGVVRFDGKYFTRYSSDDGLLNDRISSLWEDRSRRIWFGTDQGVTVLEGGVFRSYNSKDGLGIGKVGAIAEDSKGSMWFGTDSGLSHFDGRSFKTYSTADGLPDQFIHFLQFDRAGRLWIGTRKGISQFDPSRERFRNFSTRDGLLSNLMVEGSCLLDRDGKLWFGSASGVTRCDPDYRDGAAVPPLVHLEDIKVFGQPVPRTRLNELRPEENELTFNFVGLSFRDESRVRYRYYAGSALIEHGRLQPIYVLRSTTICGRALTVSVSNPPATKKTGAKLRLWTCASCRSSIRHHCSAALSRGWRWLDIGHFQVARFCGSAG